MKFRLFVVFLIFMVIISCQYENAEELYYSYIPLPNDTTQNNDTIQNNDTLQTDSARLLIDIPFNGSIEDESGNEIIVISYGSPEFSFDRFFEEDKALFLNGEDQYIEFNIDHQDTLAVSLWFNCTSGTANYSSLFDYGRNAVKTNIDGYTGPTTFAVKAYFNNFDELDALYNFSYQTWYHIYVSAGLENAIYVNGEKVGQLFENVVLELSDSNLVIGKSIHEDVANEIYFNGVIDDIKIFNYLLSDQEIIELYNENKDEE